VIRKKVGAARKALLDPPTLLPALDDLRATLRGA
jgi:hypothetical protein